MMSGLDVVTGCFDWYAVEESPSHTRPIGSARPASVAEHERIVMRLAGGGEEGGGGGPGGKGGGEG